MTVRIDPDVYDWLMAIKEATNSSSASETLRSLILKQHPNIENVVDEIRKAESKKQTILATLDGIDEEGKE